MNAARDGSKFWPLRDFVDLRCGEMQTAPRERARAQGKNRGGTEKGKKMGANSVSAFRTPFPQICVVLVTIRY
jgi:hypothetical protein